MSIVIAQVYPRMYDVERSALQAAVQASGVPAFVVNEATQSAIMGRYAKVVGMTSYRFAPLPYSPDYPCLWAQVGGGCIKLYPALNGRGGWVAMLSPDARSMTGSEPLTLACNTDQAYGLPAIFPTCIDAAHAAVFHSGDLRQLGDHQHGLFWAVSGPVAYKAPQSAPAPVAKPAAPTEKLRIKPAA